MILFYQICAARGYRWSATNGQANGRGRVLRGPEAGFDRGLTDTAATRGAADRGRIGVWRGPGEGDDSDGGKDLGFRLRAVCRVAGRDARRPGVCGSAGMLECAECVPERSGGRGAVVDEPAPGGRGADISEEEGMNRMTAEREETRKRRCYGRYRPPRVAHLGGPHSRERCAGGAQGSARVGGSGGTDRKIVVL